MKRRNLKILYLPLILTALSFIFSGIEPYKKFELATYDWRMKFLNRKEPTGMVVIVFIGDETLKYLGKWPISRNWYAEFIKVMKEFGAKSVVLDILFVEPSGKSDLTLSKVMEESNNVFLPFFFSLSPEKDFFLNGKKIYYPIPSLKNSAKGIGFINCPPDFDGIIRRYYLFAEYNNRLYPSLGMEVVRDYLGLSENFKIEKGKYVEFSSENRKMKIPINRDCSVLINFYENLNRFPNYSFIHLLQSYLQIKRNEKPIISPLSFKDKIVIVGFTATGTSDIGSVPNAPVYYMVGLQASFIENFLKNEFIKKISFPKNFGIVLLLSLFLTFIITGLSTWAGLIITFLIGGLFIFFSCWLFKNCLLWIEIIPAILSFTLSYISTTLWQLRGERRERKKLKKIFEKYIAPSVMENLLEKSGEISLGGEKKKLTVLFADIRGFTPIAENLSPEKTVELLNRILNIMVESIFRYGGTLDKFIGDGIMAIFGAPVEYEDHAKRAVLSAIEMMEGVKRLDEKIDIGIGINTGEMVIGNIGSEKRLEYTAIGDSVNLAFRIQELAKRGEILVGEETYQITKEFFNFEYIGECRIKGKKESVKIYRVNWR